MTFSSTLTKIEREREREKKRERVGLGKILESALHLGKKYSRKGEQERERELRLGQIRVCRTRRERI